MSIRRLGFTGLICTTLFGGVSQADAASGQTVAGHLQTSDAVLNYQNRAAIFEPNKARYGMVASDHFLASQIGSDILAQGGNAVDAAVATAFALAVVLPYAGNLGGGGFAVLHNHQKNQTLALDFRETAPQQAHETMFLDPQGQPIKGMSIESTASIGVPGTVAGLLTVLDDQGTLTRQAVLAPAIALALEGFEVTPTLASLLNSHAQHLYKSAPNRAIFFRKKDHKAECEPVHCPIHAMRALQAGEILRQTDLARTLQTISEQGLSGFYQGSIAQSIVDTVQKDIGTLSLQDMASYQPRWRTPIQGQYRGLEVLSMPPPSSGGVHLVQMLNMLEHYDLAKLGFGSAASLHLLTEVAKRAYADRAQYLGDPDYVDVPVTWLTSPRYAAQQVAGISLEKATPSAEVYAGVEPLLESTETTHLSVIDRWSNMVSLTTTLNLNFGSGWMAPNTGVLLNNEMDDFSAKPGVPNAFGLIGSQANRIEAGKRPLSSMTPTIVLRHGKPWLATGTPGGARIITIVLQVLINVADHGMNIAAATAAPRMHHQWWPDRIFLEPGYSPDTIRLLLAMGHQVDASRAAGRVQSVQNHAIMFQGYSDPRSADGAALGPNR